TDRKPSAAAWQTQLLLNVATPMAARRYDDNTMTNASIYMNRSMAKDATKKTHEYELELEIPDEYEETRQWLESHLSRRETLCQKAEQEDGPVPTRARFQEMLKDPDALYEDIIELIEKSRDFRAHRDNYREQLIEVKQIMQRSGTVGGTPALPEGQRSTKLPDPPLFNGSTKDRVTYDNWLIQVENKLHGNADTYPTEDLKIIYVAG
ncbi:hypothetical protein GP486_008640, partial [Trichoglossum hirsutum]